MSLETIGEYFVTNIFKIVGIATVAIAFLIILSSLVSSGSSSNNTAAAAEEASITSSTNQYSQPQGATSNQNHNGGEEYLSNSAVEGANNVVTKKSNGEYLENEDIVKYLHELGVDEGLEEEFLIEHEAEIEQFVNKHEGEDFTTMISHNQNGGEVEAAKEAAHKDATQFALNNTGTDQFLHNDGALDYLHKLGVEEGAEQEFLLEHEDEVAQFVHDHEGKNIGTVSTPPKTLPKANDSHSIISVEYECGHGLEPTLNHVGIHCGKTKQFLKDDSFMDYIHELGVQDGLEEEFIIQHESEMAQFVVDHRGESFDNLNTETPGLDPAVNNFLGP